jgi:hypothetical protein
MSLGPALRALPPRFPITAVTTEAIYNLESDNHRLVSAAGPFELSA